CRLRLRSAQRARDAGTRGERRRARADRGGLRTAHPYSVGGRPAPLARLARPRPGYHSGDHPRIEEYHMGIGASVFMLAIGAIITFALDLRVGWLDLDVVGWILMAAGALGLVLSLTFFRRRRTMTATT